MSCRGVSYTKIVPELQVNSREVSEEEFHENNSKSFSSKKYSCKGKTPPPPPQPPCTVTVHCSSPKKPEGCPVPCKPPTINNCTGDLAKDKKFCYSEITHYPPEVTIKQRSPKIERKCWPMRLEMNTCEPACFESSNCTSSGGKGSYSLCETTDRECHSTTFTDAKGRSTVLHADDWEKFRRSVSTKDSKGITNSFCKESERKSTTVSGESRSESVGNCKCLESPSGGTGNGGRYSTKVSFNPA